MPKLPRRETRTEHMQKKFISTWPCAAAVPQIDLWRSTNCSIMVTAVKIPVSFTVFLLFWLAIPSTLQAGHGSSDWENRPLCKAVLQLLSPLLAPLCSSRQEILVIQAQNLAIELILSFFSLDADLCFIYFKLRKLWKIALHRAILIIRSTFCCQDTLQFWKLLL